MEKRALFSLFMVFVYSETTVGTPSVPHEFFYTDATSSRSTTLGGCNITVWDGTDPHGISGWPTLTRVECPDQQGVTFNQAGMAYDGFLRFFKYAGSVSINNTPLKWVGDNYWVAGGEIVSVNVGPGGSMMALGNALNLRDIPRATFPSNWRATSKRFYSIDDAVNKDKWTKIAKDPHINNGTANAWDILFSSTDMVNPPAVLVANCAFEDGSYVWSHTHSQGAVYLPFQGRICFQGSDDRCIQQREARWTSPTFYYYETFHRVPSNMSNPEVEQVMSHIGATNCPSPIFFFVSNFDPDSSSGQPNFVDIPKNHQEGALGYEWGYFPSVAIRGTWLETFLVIDDGDHHAKEEL